MLSVTSISNSEVTLHGDKHAIAAALPEVTLAERSSQDFAVQLRDRSELPVLLTQLRDAGFAFVGGSAGWPPAEVFAVMRENGEVVGQFTELVFVGPGRPHVRQR
jgi:hypothetical protein